MYRCKGWSASGKCWGPIHIAEATDRASAATEYAGVVWRLMRVFITEVDVDGERFKVGNSIEFYARPAAELGLAITQ